MRDYNQVVGEIRAFIQSIDRTDDPRVARLAGEYATACAEANDRLNRCAAFLRQGLRSEAIHLARTNPDVLDMAGVLDFPERTEWDELGLAYKWPAAPSLAIEAATAISEAYALEDPLASLLQTHRRLALARAPLKNRLDTLRKIARIDPGNPVWADDVGRFEQARLTEIDREVRNARGELDGLTLESVRGELLAPGWQNAPSEQLRHSVEEAIVNVTEQTAQRELRTLVGPLNQAFQTKDAALARRLRTRWSTLVEAANLLRHDPLFGQAQAALDWLERVDRSDEREYAYREVVEDLQQALASQAKRNVLQGLEHEALAFGRDLPKPVQEELRERYRVLGRVERQRNYLALGIVGATCTLLLGAIAWSSIQAQRDAALQRGAAEVASLVNAGKVREARALIQTIEKDHPGASEAEPLSTTITRLTTLEQREDDRVKRFNEALAEAENSPLNNWSATALDNARALARLPAEKDLVERRAASHRALHEQEQQKADHKLGPLLEEFQDHLVQAESLVKSSPSAKETPAEFAKLRGLAARLRETAAPATDERKRQVNAEIARYEALENTWAGSFERERLLSDLIRTASAVQRPDDLAGYLRACERHMDKLPQDERTTALRKAFDEQHLWERALAWSSLIESWPVPATALTAQDAVQRVAQIQQIRGRYPGLPAPAEIEAYRQYGESVAKLAVAGDDNPLAQVRRLLSNPLIENVWRIRAKSGKVYYSLQKPTLEDAGYRLKYLIDVNCNEKPIFVHRFNSDGLDLSPQSQLAEQMKQLITHANDSANAWDKTMLQILLLTHKDPEIDPVLKVLILRSILRAATQGDSILGTSVSLHLQIIDNAQINLELAWMDPDDERAAAERHRARQLLKSLPALNLLEARLQGGRNELEAQLKQVYLPVGLLWKDAGGFWHCHTSSRAAANAPLYVAVPSGDWTLIGKKDGPDDHCTLDQASANLQEGRLVFVKRNRG